MGEHIMKSLGAYPLLELAFLISMLLPLHAENVRRCFVCTERSLPKCSGELSPSDTELIKECPVGIGAKGVPKGCQILLAVQTTEFASPKRDFIWRDCLYPTDLEEHGLEVTPSENDPEEKEMWWWRGSSWTGSVTAMNEKRGKLRLPPLPSYNLGMSTGRTFALIYYHPNPHPEFWNLSNGMGIASAANLVSRDFNKISRRQREVKPLGNQPDLNDGELIKQPSPPDSKTNVEARRGADNGRTITMWLFIGLPTTVFIICGVISAIQWCRVYRLRERMRNPGMLSPTVNQYGSQGQGPSQPNLNSPGLNPDPSAHSQQQS